MYTFKSEADLDIALEKLCEMLHEKGALAEGDKTKAKEAVKEALKATYGESLNNVPQDLFTDPAKRQNLIVGLITAPVMEKIPSLKFDLVLFFKAELKPEETKKLFKAFMVGLNKLEPDLNKRHTDENIGKEADALLDKLEQIKLNKGKSLKPSESKSDRDGLEETFEMLFGITRFGAPVYLAVNKGNVAGYVDSYSASSLGGGSIHDGRGFSGDNTTDPYVNAMAKERLLDIGGLGSEILRDLTASGILHKSPTPAPR